MSQPLPCPESSPPDSADLEASSALDAAILIGGMRELYRALRERARASETEAARHSYTEAMEMVEQMIQEQGKRKAACAAISAEIARQVVTLLRQE